MRLSQCNYVQIILHGKHANPNNIGKPSQQTSAWSFRQTIHEAKKHNHSNAGQKFTVYGTKPMPSAPGDACAHTKPKH